MSIAALLSPIAVLPLAEPPPGHPAPPDADA